MKIEAAFVNLNSSALARVAYDHHRQLLYVEFRDGSAYTYFDVPPAVYHELLASPSQGIYFNQRIRNAFVHSDSMTFLG